MMSILILVCTIPLFLIVLASTLAWSADVRLEDRGTGSAGWGEEQRVGLKERWRDSPVCDMIYRRGCWETSRRALPCHYNRSAVTGSKVSTRAALPLTHTHTHTHTQPRNPVSVQLQAGVVRQTPKARHESVEERAREKRRTREQ